MVFGNSKSLARALWALERSEISEKEMLVDLVGSLKRPAKQGARYGYRDKWRGLEDLNKLAFSRLQGLSINLLSNPLQVQINLSVFIFRSSLRTL